MEPSDMNGIELHVAGATVRHINPFENLQPYRNSFEMSEEFISKWVIPFYMAGFGSLTEKHESAFVKACPKVDVEVVRQLLGDFNWRPKIVGAYFSALLGLDEFEEIIGTHLLKSEVCFAGKGYCLALARFGTSRSKEFLKQYLHYYLMKPELYFDQGDALAALYYLDVTEAESVRPLWDNFVNDKSAWELARFRNKLSLSMEAIDRINQQINLDQDDLRGRQ